MIFESIARPAKVSDRVRLCELRLHAAALAYAGEESAFDLMLAASRYAEAVAEMRRAGGKDADDAR